MKRLITLLLILAPLSAIATGLSQPKQANLQQMLNQWRLKYDLPGAGMTVIMPNQKAYNFVSGVMNLKTKQPVTSNTLFQIDSITKVYTAAMILQLIQEGKLSYNETLGQLLPQYKNWKNTTILQMLNMTSGIPSFTDLKSFNQTWQKHPTKAWTPVEDLTYVENMPLQFKPGKGWHYSDSNYILLGMIIEKVTGKSYASNLQERIIKPLKLKHTFYIPREYTKAELAKIAIPYSDKGKDVSNTNMSQAGAAGAMVATTENAAHFFNAIFNGNLISKQTLKMMLTPYATKNGQKGVPASASHMESYGLGPAQFYIKGMEPMWMKPGGFVGSFAFVGHLVKANITLMIATNKVSNEAFNKMPRVFMPLIFKTILKK